MQNAQEKKSALNARPSSRLRNLLWQSVFTAGLILAFVAWKYLAHRGDPDTFHLPPSAYGHRYAVRQGQLIWITGQDKLVICSRPLAGGKERILAEDTLEFLQPFWNNSLMFATQDILYQNHKNQGNG